MAQDSFGNYVVGVAPSPYTPGNSTTGGGLLSGSGAPDNSLGDNGNAYVNVTNGAVYTKTGDTWVLQVGATGVANIVAVGSPVGTVTPDAISQFYTDSTTPGQPIVYQAMGATSADWVQLI